MNEIREWLTQSGSFESGLDLLRKHTHNRFMLQSIHRRHDTQKLRYELEKIVGIGSPAVQKQKPTTMGTIEANVRTEIVREGSIRLDELPQPLQAVYGQVCEQYRRMRSLHEKLKLVATDSERATVRKELVALDGQRREGWAVIDRWRMDGTLPVVEPAAGVESIPDYKAVQAARLAVSRLLKQLEGCDAVKAEQYREKITKAVGTIMAAGGKFNKLAEPLRRQGFI